MNDDARSVGISEQEENKLGVELHFTLISPDFVSFYSTVLSFSNNSRKRRDGCLVEYRSEISVPTSSMDSST